MNTFLFSATLLAVVMAGNVRAQIYADFQVSHDSVSLGTFRVELDYVNAPRTCANFIGLATGQKAWLDTTTGKVVTGKKYYDGLKFHRLIHSFMIQGGDPQGNGGGGPGYVFQDEFDSSLRHNKKYMLSMANSGICTNGSQFFIMLVDDWGGASALDDKHSIFGKVTTGTAIIDGFTDDQVFPVQLVNPSLPEDPNTNPKTSPVSSIVIDSVMISGPSLAGFDINAPSLLLPLVDGVKTSIAYNPSTITYGMTWDRKFQTEYFTSFTDNFQSWIFETYRYRISMEAESDFQRSWTWVGGKLFTCLTGVDYSLLPNAPSNLAAAGNVLALTTAGGEVITLTFDGSGGGSWSLSTGGSGNLNSVAWTDELPTIGFYNYVLIEDSRKSLAPLIPQGTLEVVFDSPVGSESWPSFSFSANFHTSTSGWLTGGVPVFPVIPGGGTINKRVTFTYTPTP